MSWFGDHGLVKQVQGTTLGSSVNARNFHGPEVVAATYQERSEQGSQKHNASKQQHHDHDSITPSSHS